MTTVSHETEVKSGDPVAIQDLLPEDELASYQLVGGVMAHQGL